MKYVSAAVRARINLFRAALSLIIIAAALAAARMSPAQSTDPSVIGQWSSDSPWPTVGVHLIVLPDGRVLTWGEDIPAPGATAFPTYVVSIPSGSTDTSGVRQLIINDDIFCGGHNFMTDGRVFVAGGGDQPAPTDGTGRITTDIFDPTTNTWSSGPAMSEARWYPTVTPLSDGELAILDGSQDANFTSALTPDVVSADGTKIRSLTGVSGTYTDFNYPRAFVAPNGQIFTAGMEQTTRYLNTAGTGAYTVVGNSNFGFRTYGTAVMYAPGKIMIAGGMVDSSHPPTNTAEVIDLNSSVPSWSYISPMNYARVYLNSTILADGTVLISGGTSSTGDDDASGAVLPAEIWNPATQKFSVVASMPHYRLYHSTTGLLPDGRVISAGTTPANGTGGGIAYKDADFYSPPYLFNGARPTISSAPSTVNYGQSFAVNTPDAANITAVNLIGFGSTTHHFNFHQRFNALSFTQNSGSLTVSAPSGPNLAPPGPYMLFILNSSGVPSIASTIYLENGSGPVPTPTPAPTNTTVQITSPTNGSTVSGTVNIGVFASSAVSWVNVYIDGNYFASSPPFTFNWDSTKVANGSHTISVTANNSSGVIGRDSVTVTVNNGGATPTPTPTGSVSPTPTPTPTPTGSVVKITSPANGSTVSGTVSIAISASSAVGWVDVYIDGHYLASSPPFTFSWNSTTVANGSHTISVTAFNGSGAIGQDSVTVTVANGGATPTPSPSVTPTTTPTGTPTATPTPTGSVVKITSPTNGSTVSGTVNIAVSASSTVSWVNVYIDGNYFASSPPFTFSWNSTAVPNGTHTISVTANNGSGVIGQDSVTVTVSNGSGATPTPAPSPTPAGSVVQITSPTNGSTVSGTVNIAVSVSSSVAWVNVYIDGAYFASSPPYTFSWNSTTVANGSHTISVTANDSGGVIGRASISVNVSN